MKNENSKYILFDCCRITVLMSISKYHVKTKWNIYFKPFFFLRSVHFCFVLIESKPQYWLTNYNNNNRSEEARVHRYVICGKLNCANWNWCREIEMSQNETRKSWQQSKMALNCNIRRWLSIKIVSVNSFAFF